jgi:hypothetical protein
MFETVWPRLRTLGRLFGFLGGLAVIGVAGLSILQNPTAGVGGDGATAAVAPELLAIVGAAMWMLLVTKL